MLKVEMVNDIPEVKPEEVMKVIGKIRLIDVRNPDEFVGELGHIRTAELVTLGPDLQEFIEKGNCEEEIIFICRSGARSGRATMFCQQMGYKKVYNMQGGMLNWNAQGLPIEK